MASARSPDGANTPEGTNVSVFDLELLKTGRSARLRASYGGGNEQEANAKESFFHPSGQPGGGE